jgi:hypothetical protein
VIAATKTLAVDRGAVTKTLAVGVTPVTEPLAVGVTPAVTPSHSGTTATEPFAVAVTPAVTPSQSELAVLNAGRRRGVFSRADLTIEIAAALPVVVETAEQVRVQVEHLTDGSVGHWTAMRLGAPTVGVTPRASDARFTSREVLQTEAAVLHVAAAGQRKHVGQVPALDRELVAGLGPDQRAAVTRLTTGGDFLIVLTAPAGAGKTTTLGAAAKIWENAGFRVVGLAPSARAAAELAKATGGATETLAKWLHQQARLSQLPAHEQAAWSPTARTVLVVDEASMASTFDLHTLTRIARNARAKVVLVGDPAQIGTINAPGGLIAALAARGHGIELDQVHRFRHEWEAQASLRLRDGDRTVIDTYNDAGRLHTVPNPDTAAAAVFEHWQRARSDGAEVMMLARTRDDVNQLNALAKIAAQAAGESHGPQVLVGEKAFQAGDVIRTRRNNRSITLGDTHVRNGDRYTILATTEDAGLVVDDLSGKGRTVLPASYVADHVEHGWANTIDGAQGATTDIAILLARPGIDREHLYVGLTRGRDENHAYLAPAVDDDHAHPPVGGTGARALLQAALNRSGSNDAAHTLLDRANAAIRPALPMPSAPAIQTAASEEAAARSRRLATQQIIDQHRRAERGTGRGIGI